MLSYINLSIQNDSKNAGIVFISEANTENVSSINKIEISRKVHGANGGYTLLQTINITSVDDLNFSLMDIYALSGTSYDYNVDIKNNNAIVEFQVFSNVKCSFDGLFIGNIEQYYVAQTNFNTEVNKNIVVDYVTTLTGKYPYRIANANVNYYSGSSSGLFLEDYECDLLPDTYHAYANKVIEFLVDGTSKILKTHDGLGWFVGIDASPSKIKSDFVGMNAIEFKWTEIGDMPTYGMVVM